jgi:hypothetical protein
VGASRRDRETETETETETERGEKKEREGGSESSGVRVTTSTDRMLSHVNREKRRGEDAADWFKKLGFDMSEKTRGSLVAVGGC